MKNLKLLSKKLLLIIFILFTSFKSYSSDKPVDIWNLNEKNKEQNSDSSLPINQSNNSIGEISIYKNVSSNETSGVVEDTFLSSKMI